MTRKFSDLIRPTEKQSYSEQIRTVAFIFYWNFPDLSDVFTNPFNIALFIKNYIFCAVFSIEKDGENLANPEDLSKTIFCCPN
jgi:hypothetical protein